MEGERRRSLRLRRVGRARTVYGAPMRDRRGPSPVLLLGAGTGEATCGILYLAGFLRRAGVEAYVRLHDDEGSSKEIARSIEALVARVRPRLVGISLKWFHHVHRALALARAVKRVDPTVEIVMGGNSASSWWRELLTFDCVDHVIFGDGEVPLLALCEGDPAPPNCVSRGGVKPPLTYVQGPGNSDGIHYSHFDEVFLSQRDRHAFSGWVAPGKGCAETCLYCGGARKNQKEVFGRVDPYLRSPIGVREDHREIAPRTWQVRYDFSGASVAFLDAAWAGVDLSRHSCTWFLWGRPSNELIDALARTFFQVYVVIDVGCFSERQRLDLMRRGVLKACATDPEVDEVIAYSRRYPNVEVEVSGIAGLPYASAATLEEEERLVDAVIARGCVAGYQRLEAQPGAAVTDKAEKFGMRTEARTFSEFLDYFERRPPGDSSVPMVRFAEDALEEAVAETADRVLERAHTYRVTRRMVALTGRTRLRKAAPIQQTYTLGAWLGTHVAPPRLANEAVTVVRSRLGTELVCAPSVRAPAFPGMSQGEEARCLLATLDAFAAPTTVATAAAAVRSRLGPDVVLAAIQALADDRFLEPG